MREWEESMEERPDAVKRSTQGKQAAAMQLQSAEYLKPLFKSLRKRVCPSLPRLSLTRAQELEPDVLKLVAEITHNMQNREYVKANDAYIRLSIGTAAWPIGVTAVGIHARSARERIHTDSVAHVLNDEVSRKYIQSLKRCGDLCCSCADGADCSPLLKRSDRRPTTASAWAERTRHCTSFLHCLVYTRAYTS